MATLQLAQLPQVLEEFKTTAAALPANAYVVTQATIDAVDGLHPNLSEGFRPALPVVNGIPRAFEDRLVPWIQRLVTVALLVWFDIFLHINGNGPLTAALGDAFLDSLLIYAGDNGTSDNPPEGAVYIPDGAGNVVDVEAADFWDIIKSVPTGRRQRITVRKFFTSLAPRAKAKGIPFKWGANLGLTESASDVSFDFARGLNQYKVPPTHRAAAVNSTARAIESAARRQDALAHRQRLPAGGNADGFDI